MFDAQIILFFFFNLLEHFTNAPVWLMQIAFNLISVGLHLCFETFLCYRLLEEYSYKKVKQIGSTKTGGGGKK